MDIESLQVITSTCKERFALLGNKENMRCQISFLQGIDIDSLVPKDYYLRLVDEAVDFSFIRDKIAPLYSKKTGRPSIDPEMAFRMITLSYLLDLSENQFFEEIPMHAGYLWFCGLDFGSTLPDRTTVVKLRKRCREAGLFDEFLKEIVRQCIQAGLVKGDLLAVDGTIIQARASIKSLEAINPKPVTVYLEELQKEDEKTLHQADDSDDGPGGPGENHGDGSPSERTVSVLTPNEEHQDNQDLPDNEPPAPMSTRKSGDPDFHGEKFSNQTHRSTTDPEARLFRKGQGKEAKLSYLGHSLIDVRSGVILNAMATLANGALERTAALTMLKETAPSLPGLTQGVKRIFLADGNYTAGDFLAEVIDLGYEPLVPMESPGLEPIPTWKNKTSSLARLRNRKERVRIARARNYARILNRTGKYRGTYRYRIRVEHIFAEGKDHHSLGRAKSYGLAAVNEQVNMTAVVQNIKRLTTLVWRRKKRAAKEMGLSKPALPFLLRVVQQIEKFLAVHYLPGNALI